MARRYSALSVALVMSLATSVAFASPIAPGSAVLTNGNNLGATPGLAGAIIDSGIQPFVGVDSLGNIKFTGTLFAAVVQEVSGTLSFYYQVHNDLTSPDALERFTNQSFAGFTTDVDYRTDGLAGIAIHPLSANPVGTVGSRFATRNSTGAVVGFTMPSTGITQGADSYWHYIRTNATQYTNGSTALLNGGIATVTTFAPLVPEPTTLALVAMGAFALVRRRNGR